MEYEFWLVVMIM